MGHRLPTCCRGYRDEDRGYHRDHRDEAPENRRGGTRAEDGLQLGLQSPEQRGRRLQVKNFRCSCGCLEFEATFARGVGELFDFAVIRSAGTVENNRLDSRCLRFDRESST